MMTQTDSRAAALTLSSDRRSPAWVLVYGLLTIGLVAIFCVVTAGIAWRRLIYAPYAGLWLLRLLPLALLLAAAATSALVLRELGLAARTAVWSARLGLGWRRHCALIAAAAVALSVGIVWVLRAFPNSGDEYAYLWMARTFLAGRLWNPLPPIPDLFALAQTGFFGTHWVTVYGPGWPALLAGGMEVGLPAWLICPLAGGALLALAALLGHRRDGPLGGVLATALVAASPFFLFNAASYFTQVPAAAAGLLFCWSAGVFLERPRLRTALLCGAALGFLGVIRTADAAIFALPFAAEFLWRAGFRHYRLAPAITLAGLPFLAALMGYYWLTIGAVVPHLPVIAQSVKFGAAAVGDRGQAAVVLPRLLLAASRLVALAEWSSPLLVLAAAAAFVALAWRRRLSFVDLVFPMFVVAYLFVPFDGGNQYGPRYYFEGFPCLVLTLVDGLVPLLQDKLRPRRAAFGWFSLVAHGAICAIVLAFLCVGMRRVVDQRMDLYDQVRARQLHDAVIVVRSGTSDMYKMFPPDLVRDGIDAQGDVIYVLDVPQQMAGLRRLYPRRRFYVYERKPDRATGALRPLQLSPARTGG
ncbi:MAG TPA: hypothetical protein VMF86_05295 [Stellaceae bacterium]|nr:hypothetical protein [Stellaceae bacterium]